jgi:hypothetical protein
MVRTYPSPGKFRSWAALNEGARSFAKDTKGQKTTLRSLADLNTRQELSGQ